MSAEFIHISLGGPEFNISVGGKIYHFEMHPHCGPIWLKNNGDARTAQPQEFLAAASLWHRQGQRVENGLCIWHHDAKPILKHLFGNNYQVMGHNPPETGQ